ncbi:DUF4097 family beta strand repeat-containing protein [Kitasatospora misakiensis]|uniref:DUF4097 family beta strand repeat-containing protein n=1 Tax=Kitasatospora misakiensis TaxID=67330 RepID=A0ABW0X3G8_9ACTN
MLALSVAAACWGIVALLSAERGYTETLRADAADSTRLRIEAGSAGITLTPGDDAVVRVSATGSYLGTAPAVALSTAGGEVTVRAACGAECSLQLRVTVPAGLAATVESAGGEIAASGLGGPLDLSSRSGLIRVTGSAGPLVLRSESGSVTVTDSRSPSARITTGQGTVRAAFAAPPTSVEITTGDGGADLTVPGSAEYSIDARSSAGTTPPQVNLPIDRNAARTVTVRTGGGGILIH